MRRRNRFALSIALVLVCALGVFVLAQVSFNPANFQAGEVVSASAFNDLLNDNFTAVGTAIAGLEADKQERVSGTCAEGSAVRVVGSDGSVTCQVTGTLQLPFHGSSAPPSDGAILEIGASSPGGTTAKLTSMLGTGLIVEDAATGVFVDDAVQYGLRVGSGAQTGLEVDSATVYGVRAGSAVIGGDFSGGALGVIARSESGAAPDVMLGSAGADDPGWLAATESPASDMHLTSNGDVRVELDADGAEVSTFLVVDDAGDMVFSVNELGMAFVDGTLTELSDEKSKRQRGTVDRQSVLAALSELPITYWSYVDDPEVTHIGPTAQAFGQAFEVGANSTSISTIDRDGVALAAIQGLHELVLAQQAEIRELEARLAALESRP